MKVMVVEDYDDTRALVKMMLEMKGCDVVEAADGQQAVSLAKVEGVNLILMDLNLPVLDGYGATRQILADPKTRHIPIVAFSAQCSGDRCRKALDAGCLDVVEKPMDFDKLDTLISRYAASN